MLRLSCVRLRFVIGFKIGSKHQKHQVFAPVPFLYRFPGDLELRTKPGPILMKYWHALGCFPSGLEVPFRLEEFIAEYKNKHVPAEVEEWLGVNVFHPADAITSNLAEFVRLLEDTPMPKQYSWRKPQLYNIGKVVEPLNKAMEQYYVAVPPIAIRGVALHPPLRNCVLDTAFELEEEVRVAGSTPHRRWAAQQIQAPMTDEERQQYFPPANDISLPDQNVTEIVAKTTQVGATSSRDENLVVRLLSLFAEGAYRMDKSDEASSLLDSAFVFAQDGPLRAHVHANMASAKNLQGHFKEAEFHAKEAVLENIPKGYANWAIATAYLDDHDKALQIAAEGLQAHPEDQTMNSTYRSIVKAVAGKAAVAPEARSRRYHVDAQLLRGIVIAEGVGFDNRDSTVLVNNKEVYHRLDPSYLRADSPARRIGSAIHCAPMSTYSRDVL